MPLPDVNLIVCHGDDDIAILEYVHYLTSEVADDATGDVNISRFDGRISSDKDLANVVMSTPFFAEKRLVILEYPFARMGRVRKTEADEEGLESGEGGSSEQKNAFLGILENLPDSTILVLMVEDSSIWDSKARTKNWSVLKKSHFLMKWAASNPGKCLIRSFALPDSRDMPAWIQKKAAGMDCKFKADAAAELAQFVGNDTRLAAMEIEKLSLYVGGKRPVEMEDVMALSTSTSSATIWNLVDAVGQKDTHRALSLFHQLLEIKDVQYEIFPMIIRQFRLLLMAREVLDERGNEQAVIQELGVAPYVAKNLVPQAGKFSMKALERVYLQLMKIEEESKTRGGDMVTAIDTLIVSAAG